MEDLRQIILVYEMIKEHMKWGSDKTFLWLSTSNPHFGNISPAEMILRGRGHKVIKFIQTTKEESKQ